MYVQYITQDHRTAQHKKGQVPYVQAWTSPWGDWLLLSR